jgi:hypothetical protein
MVVTEVLGTVSLLAEEQLEERPVSRQQLDQVHQEPMVRMERLPRMLVRAAVVVPVVLVRMPESLA